MASYSRPTDEECKRLCDYVLRAQRDRFSHVNHMRLTGADRDCVTGELEVVPDVLNPWGVVHGGCLVTLADTTAGTLNFINGKQSVTLNCSVNFLRAARGKYIRCTAKVQKMGRSTSVIEASLTDEKGQEVCTGVYTFFHMADVTPADLEELPG